MSMLDQARNEYRDLASRIILTHDGEHILNDWYGKTWLVEPAFAARLAEMFPRFKNLRVPPQ